MVAVLASCELFTNTPTALVVVVEAFCDISALAKLLGLVYIVTIFLFPDKSFPVVKELTD